jgi:hypothetical protein
MCLIFEALVVEVMKGKNAGVLCLIARLIVHCRLYDLPVFLLSCRHPEYRTGLKIWGVGNLEHIGRDEIGCSAAEEYANAGNEH